MAGVSEKYLVERAILAKQSFPEADSSLRLSVVIPAYREPRLDITLEELINCKIESPESLEVIVVLNRPYRDIEAAGNMKINATLIEKCNKRSDFPIHGLSLVFKNSKKAGVGLARKMGMDLALQRFLSVGNEAGWIVCLDADCRLSPNYLSKLLSLQENDKEAVAGSLYFEHVIPPEGPASAIYQYELHLRYYVQMQRSLDLPYAFHTVGSSMFVRALDYAKQGGMNTRKAGEDFYFLHKFTLDKNFRDYHQPVVYPSGRASTRVPFGTGRAVLEFDQIYNSYAIESFEDLSQFLDWVRQKAKSVDKNISAGDRDLIPHTVVNFLQWEKFERQWNEILRHTASTHSFMKRFYQWFNAFRLMKCVHFLRDQYYPSKPILNVAREALKGEWQDQEKDLLEIYRQKNRNTQWRAG